MDNESIAIRLQTLKKQADLTMKTLDELRTEKSDDANVRAAQTKNR
jgi:hypothetical protein